MIQRVIEMAVPRGTHRLIAVVPPEVPEMYDVERIVLSKVTDGAARTVTLAIHLSQCDLDDPLMIVNSDQLLDWNVNNMLDDPYVAGSDGAVVLFKADGSTRWSYAECNGGNIVRIAEKQPISNWATAGVYYWRRTYDFLDAATAMMATDDRVNGEFYVAPTYNYAIREGARIAPFVISTTAFHDLGTPEALDAYLSRTVTRVGN